MKSQKKGNDNFLNSLKSRFESNMSRHKIMKWDTVQELLLKNPKKLAVLQEMESTGGEPDLVDLNGKANELIFIDCSKETPSGRKSLCYDQVALKSRKQFKPKGSAVGLAEKMGIEMLDETQYLALQKFGPFDTKTSSWIKTPAEMRKLGGALFGDHRFGRTFFYHNGAESYYGSRGFRGLLKIR